MTVTDLTTRYLGLQLANPVVASASPLTGDVGRLVELQSAGVAAVVLPSLFEEQVVAEALAVHDELELGIGHHPEATDGYLPELDGYNSGPERYLDLVHRATDALDIPVIASLNGVTPGGWTAFARDIEDTGADALELNVYYVAADLDRSSAEIDDQYVRLVEQVRAAVSMPLAVKIGPYVSSPGHLARRLVDAGADGLVLFNRFYQPDIDLDELTVVPNLQLSTSADLRLTLRWMAILHGRLDASLAATTGVHTDEDAIKLILAGADVTMMTAALLQRGPHHVAGVLDGIRAWFGDRDYVSVDQARGSLSQLASPDPTAFERANYIRTLMSHPLSAISAL
ncbi:MAG: dihydroorotate dehydrogenase-like protein [Actinomycetota bacterium]|nr:dihydroorotate dehydrogenase-like protein [Actinomycetota bacterium]